MQAIWVNAIASRIVGACNHNDPRGHTCMRCVPSMYANILRPGRLPLRLRRTQESLVPFEGTGQAHPV